MLENAIQALVEWGVPVIGAALAAWIAVKRKQIAAWWRSRREQQASVAAMPAALSKVAEQVDKLAGSNIRTTEEFRAVNVRLDEQSEHMKAQSKVLADISALSYGQMEQDPTARFVCDNFGRNRLVNTAYARMVGCGRDELTDFGYKRFMLHSENPGYFEGFAEASKQHRTYEADVIFRRPDGSRFRARVRQAPHPEDIPPATHWNGTVKFLHEVNE